MINARETITPHHIGSIAAAERETTARLETWGSPHAERRATELVRLFVELGWRSPGQPDPVPPLNGPGGSTAAARQAARDTLAATIAANRARRVEP